MPIGWVAVGDPASILPPDQHDRIWAVQEPLNFPEWVYGFNRSTPDLMIEITSHHGLIQEVELAQGVVSAEPDVQVTSVGCSRHYIRPVAEHYRRTDFPTQRIDLHQAIGGDSSQRQVRSHTAFC